MAIEKFPTTPNQGITTLNGALTNVATSMPVASIANLGLTGLSSPDFALLKITKIANWRKHPINNPENFEIVKLTAVTGDIGTIVREQDGTTGTAFGDLDIVECQFVSAHYQQVADTLTDGTKELNVGGLIANTSKLQFLKGLYGGPVRNIQISGGAIAINATDYFIGVEPETGTADILQAITGGTTGQIILITPKDLGDTITLESGTGADQIINRNVDDTVLESTTLCKYMLGAAGRWIQDSTVIPSLINGADDINIGKIRVGDAGAPAQELDINGDGDISGSLSVHGDSSIDGFVKLVFSGELTIVAGVVTATGSFHTIDTEGDIGSDNLDTISGVPGGTLLWLKASSALRTVVLKHGTGNILNDGGVDVSLDDQNRIVHYLSSSGNLIQVK